MPVAFLHKDKTNKLCDFCHKTSTVMYRTQVGVTSPQYWLHPGACLSNATKNYKENLEKGIQNIIQLPKDEEDNEYDQDMNL